MGLCNGLKYERKEVRKIKQYVNVCTTLQVISHNIHVMRNNLKLQQK